MNKIEIIKPPIPLNDSFVQMLEERQRIDGLSIYNTEPSKIFFYEWSQTQTAREFHTDSDFFHFLLSSKIYTSTQEDKTIKRFSHNPDGAFIVCKPNCTKLIIANSKSDMETEFNAIKQKSQETSPKQAHMTTTYTPQAPPLVPRREACPAHPMYGGYGAYGNGPEYDRFDEWD